MNLLQLEKPSICILNNYLEEEIISHIIASQVRDQRRTYLKFRGDRLKAHCKKRSKSNFGTEI